MVKAAPLEAGVRPVDARGGSTIRVVSMQTGLPMETLRAWERRYGFPTPERRPGSNRRLYSPSDVERLLVIRRALERGYRVGDVIGKSAPDLEALVVPALSPARAPTTADATATVEALVELLARDRISLLENELRRAAAALGPRRFVVELAHPFAVRVGEAWAEGRLLVRHEHLATECLVTQLRNMLATYQDIQARPLVILATLPGETHTLALQMVALFVVVAGVKARLLGGPTPAQEILEAARVLKADVVGLTVTPASDRKEARKAIRSLRRALPSKVPIWLGGGGAEALRVDDESTRVVATWSSLDLAISEWRRTPRKGASW
jgi:DNA-binding transcriptional MerR regulator/methylmalonyl-CoA mutase cobalamin-binding subunit